MTDGTVDSGIEFDIASLLSENDVIEVDDLEATVQQQQHQVTVVEPLKYHELKSRVVVLTSSPRADFRSSSSMGSRTQLRQNLERQQMLESEQREKQQQHLARQQHQQSQGIAMPASYHSTEVPPKILQHVKTNLQNPTLYHIKQKQQQAVKSYLEDSGERLPAHSVPNFAVTTAAVEAEWVSGSAPTDMEASGFDDMGLLDSIILDQPVDFHSDTDLLQIEPSLTQMSTTLPPQALYTTTTYSTLEVDSASAKSSSSCPPIFQTQLSPPNNMSEEQQKMWAKDRQKKDNHNMIERRRRFNINDRIKELGTLLPKYYDQDMRQNKGSILKASVDYIKKLKKDSDRTSQAIVEKSNIEKELQKMTLRYNQLVAIAKQQGNQAIMGLLEEHGSEMMVNPSSIFAMHQFQPHPAPSPSPASSSASNSLLVQSSPAVATYQTEEQFSESFNFAQDFLEDCSPVSGDPMMTSAPVTPDRDDDDSTF